MKLAADQLIKWTLIVLAICALIWAYFYGAFDFILEYPDDFWFLVTQHLKLIGLSGLLAIIVAVPLGILVTRPGFKKLQWFVVNFANIGQTIPSLAVLALAMSYLGIGFQTAVFGLWINSLLPIIRNTIAGIENVDPAVLDAGRGMGMSPRQILFKLELPNALYAIMAGIRTSMVINVGTAALAFLIGGGGLGDLIFTGLSLNDMGIMLSGAIPVIFLALIVDFLIGGIEKIIVPKGLQRNANLI